MNKEQVLKLAKLARIEIADTEADALSHEFDAILKYVSEVKNATKDTPLASDSQGVSLVHKNVMREDKDPHESGIYTEKILEQAPNKDHEYIKVKKILGWLRLPN